MMSQEQINQIIAWLDKIEVKMDAVVRSQNFNESRWRECQERWDERYERKRNYSKFISDAKNLIILINTIVLLLVVIGNF